jgi:Protein of unknown function, DUF481
VRRPVLAAVLLLLAAGPAAARDKDDWVILENGDRLTGEVKSMSRGKLDLSTNDAGRVSIEWDKISRLASTHTYEAELTTGERFTGPLSSPVDGKISVGTAPDSRVVAITDVVQLVPMEDAFLQRVRAFLDLGFTLAKSNWATTLSTSGEFAYRTQALGAKVAFDGYFQDDANNVAVSRWSVSLQGDWYFENRWRALVGVLAERNDELQLLLRATIAPGVAHSVVRNGWTEVWLTGGLAGSREAYVNGESNLALDLLLGASWDAFRYDTPKLDMNVSLVLLPGLTDFGRLRGSFTLKVKYEVFKDFNVGISFNDAFDTRPPDPTAPNNDFITSLTIGWSYRR